jgi:WD40 repeat protein
MRPLQLLFLLLLTSFAAAQQPTPEPQILTPRAVLPTKQNAPYSLSFSGDGRQLVVVSASTDEATFGLTALEWFADDSRREIVQEGEVFFSAALHPFLPQVYTGSYSGRVDRYSVPDFALQDSILGHESAPLLLFASDGAHFISADWSGLLIWSGVSHEVTFIVTNPDAIPGDPARAAISADGQLVAWLSYPSTVMITSITTGELVGQVVTGYNVEPYQIGFTPNNQVAMAYGTLEIWDPNTNQRIDRVITADAVRDFIYSRDGTRLILLTADNVVRVLDAASGQTLALANAEGAQAWGMALSLDGRRLAVGLNSAAAVYDMP